MRTLVTMVRHRLLLFLATCQVLKFLWHFENITWESMGKEKGWPYSETEENLGLEVLQWTYVGYFWCPSPEFGFGIIWCTLQNFRFYDFRNTTPGAVFIIFQPNFIQSIIIRGYYGLLRFWRSVPNEKFYGTLKFLLTHDHMGLEISNIYSFYSFHRIPSKLYEDIAYMGECRLLLILAIG